MPHFHYFPPQIHPSQYFPDTNPKLATVLLGGKKSVIPTIMKWGGDGISSQYPKRMEKLIQQVHNVSQRYAIKERDNK